MLIRYSHSRFIIKCPFPRTSSMNFHLRSFVFGVASGLLILLIVVGGYRVLKPSSQTMQSSTGTSEVQSGQGGLSTSRMAQRFGITEAELQQELASGKTMQQIASEHGVTYTGRRQTGSGSTLSLAHASGSTVVGRTSSASSSISSQQ